ncbi:hypothetical protein QR721_05110 [Aciduricibacillus chroicocephali]|uniref:Spore coat protein n=1 Tax=Aciduricibacillus chroicocephali TaxID=3054939 RepID=A0ABY9KXM2_9BACI|nr:hypothetical protein QR721_05110 [Bacillaceae bacterium 44XB]
MSAQYYQLCNRHKGKPVVIREKGGKVHRGIIERVDRNYVYLRPVNAGRGIGGFGSGYYYGPGYGYGYGYGYGWGRVALGAIAGFALATALFW